MWKFVVLLALIAVLTTAAKEEFRLCIERPLNVTFAGHGYLFSWESTKTELLQLSWYDARDFCRARCMDLAGLETLAENEFIKQHIVQGGVNRVWTSGRKCNFLGCENEAFQPPEVFGWFWANSLERMPPTTNREDTDWSETGGLGVPQPDNRERLQGGAEEDCVAILNNMHQDGVCWHDMACHHRLRFVCEKSEGKTITPHESAV